MEPAVSIRSLGCLLEILGFSTISETGAIQGVATELRQEIKTCLQDGIRCVTTLSSTVSVELLFQEEMELITFETAANALFDDQKNKTTFCNVTSLITQIRFSDKLATPPQCAQYIHNTSEVTGIFNSHNNSYDTVMSHGKYEFDFVNENYTSKIAPAVCAINTNLNCNATITLNQSEFVLNTQDNSVFLPASNTTLKSVEFLLLSDGMIQICPFTLATVEITKRRNVLDIIGAICQSLSIIALLATLITYTLFATLRNAAGKAVMNIAGALMVAYLGLLFAGVFSFSNKACTTWAVITHYFWIAAFAWMTIFAFGIAKTFSGSLASGRRSDGGYFWKYMLFGWSIPSIVIIICIALHICGCTDFSYGILEENVCFLHGNAILYALVIPISVFLILSVSFFIFMAIHLRRQRSSSRLVRSGGTAEEISYEVAIYLRVSHFLVTTYCKYLTGYALSFLLCKCCYCLQVLLLLLLFSFL